jgi:hypothetical protein
VSTRTTLWHNEDFHLYQEGFDEENVYLEIRSRYFESLIFKLPLMAWKEMRQHTIQPMERYLDFSDEELRAEAEREVDEHRRELAGQPDSPFKGFLGSFTFGPKDSSREEMIEHFLNRYWPESRREARDVQRAMND